MAPDDRRHGTPAGYDAHGRAGETACARCRRAAAAYEATLVGERSRGYRRTIPAAGVARRVQALVAIGYTFGVIGDALGVGHDQPQKWSRWDTRVRQSTARRVADLYDAWSMRPAPETTGKEKWRASYARTVAARHGWVPPLAWDDETIDDPTATPAVVDDSPVVDEVAVQRFLSGDHTVALTRPERLLVIDHWTTSGRSLRSLTQITGWNVERYVRGVQEAAS